VSSARSAVTSASSVRSSHSAKVEVDYYSCVDILLFSRVAFRHRTKPRCGSVPHEVSELSQAVPARPITLASFSGGKAPERGARRLIFDILISPPGPKSHWLASCFNCAKWCTREKRRKRAQLCTILPNLRGREYNRVLESLLSAVRDFVVKNHPSRARARKPVPKSAKWCQNPRRLFLETSDFELLSVSRSSAFGFPPCAPIENQYAQKRPFSHIFSQKRPFLRKKRNGAFLSFGIWDLFQYVVPLSKLRSAMSKNRAIAARIPRWNKCALHRYSLSGPRLSTLVFRLLLRLCRAVPWW
jgi:hypothetical protein